MIYYLCGETKPYVAALDIEYDGQNIIQLSSIMLKCVGPHIYQVCRNINVYIDQGPISRFVQNYTHITQALVDSYGVSLEEAQEQWKVFLSDIAAEDLKFVSHGIYQDALHLSKNGFDIDDYEHQCTYTMAKHILDRNSKLTLNDILTEGGLITYYDHNAYEDAKTTINVYAYLLKLQGEL